MDGITVSGGEDDVRLLCLLLVLGLIFFTFSNNLDSKNKNHHSSVITGRLGTNAVGDVRLFALRRPDERAVRQDLLRARRGHVQDVSDRHNLIY